MNKHSTNMFFPATGATIYQQDFEASPASPTLTYTSSNTSVSSGNGNTPSDPNVC